MMHNHFEENSLGWHQDGTFCGADGHHFPPTLWQQGWLVHTVKGKLDAGYLQTPYVWCSYLP